MSTGTQASSMRGVQASSSIDHRFGPYRPTTEKITKHRDDLENVKLIPTILPDYIPPLASGESWQCPQRLRLHSGYCVPLEGDM
jgi:hypothetical protein